jgi:hypothetical protein
MNPPIPRAGSSADDSHVCPDGAFLVYFSDSAGNRVQSAHNPRFNEEQIQPDGKWRELFPLRPGTLVIDQQTCEVQRQEKAGPFRIRSEIVGELQYWLVPLGADQATQLQVISQW